MIFSLVIAGALSFVPLPPWLAFARPAVLPLVIFFWVLLAPRQVGLLVCWGLGIVMDVLYGTSLGQHALALVACGFFLLQFNEFIRSYRLWQQAVLFLPLFLLYEFLLFWMDGLNGRPAEPLWRWAPAITSALCWPFLCGLMRGFIR
jgi:rod shape-determining protein MreD